MAQARLFLDQLRQVGVTHVVGLPDNSSMKLFELIRAAPGMHLIPVTREGEAFAIAAGLWMGGAVPAVLIQNTGFFESGDSFRGTITRIRVPLVCLITYRGYAKMAEWRRREPEGKPDARTLSRASLDSAALITEATLEAWGMPYAFFHGDEDRAAIAAAFRSAQEEERPFAVLVTCDLG
jgi:sulfopyruvate decarboxylase TPP-binding subunit